MNEHLVMLAVSGVVALGTLLYYMFTEKPEPQRSGCNRPRRSSPPTSPLPPPTSYSDIKPFQRRKSVEANPKVVISQEVDVPDPVPQEMDNIDLVPQEMDNIDLVPQEMDNIDLVPQEMDNIDHVPQEMDNIDLEPICSVCEEYANTTLYPCKDKVFCEEHVQYYFNIAKKHERKPKCPKCQKEIQYFTVE